MDPEDSIKFLVRLKWFMPLFVKKLMAGKRKSKNFHIGGNWDLVPTILVIFNPQIKTKRIKTALWKKQV